MRSILTPADAGILADVSGRLDRALAELRVVRELLEGKRKPLLTIGEVAREVGRDPYTVRAWIKSEKLPATRVGGTGPKGRLLVRRDDLDRILAAGLGAAVPAAALAAGPGGEAADVS